MKMTANIFAQHLITTPKNYSCAYMGRTLPELTGDKVERYLKGTKFTSANLWDVTKGDIIVDDEGLIVFDDTVLSHKDADNMELVYEQWSGNEHRVVKGVGVVVCLYTNHLLNQSWVIDYRIYDKDNDCRTKVELAVEMYKNLVCKKFIHNNTLLPFRYVLFDAAYANVKLIASINDSGKYYLTNMKGNRLGREEIHGIESNNLVQLVDMNWDDDHSLNYGKVIRLKGYPIGRKVKVFSLAIQSDRIDFIVTNDFSIISSTTAYEVSRVRWDIECINRELKQIIGFARCVCRKQRSQRTFIHICLVALLFLKRKARELNKTTYRIKESQFDEYYRKLMENPIYKFDLL